MGYVQVIDEKYPGWDSYTYRAYFSRNIAEFEIWAWKDEREAARESVARILQEVLNKGLIPLRARAWADWEGVFYSKIKVQIDIGVHNPEIHDPNFETAALPLIPIAIVIGAILLVEWLRPGTTREVAQWLWKNVGAPVVGFTWEALKPFILIGAGVLIVVGTLKAVF